MLSCKDVSERADALIDGDLGPVERLQMRFHLAICAGCRRFMRQLRQTRALIRHTAGLEGDDPPAPMVEALFARAAAEAEGPAPSRDHPPDG